MTEGSGSIHSSIPRERLPARAGDVLLLAALLAVPLAVHPALYRPFTSPKHLFLAVLAILLLPASGTYLFMWRKGEESPSLLFPLLLVSWVLVHIFSSLFSGHIRFSLEHAAFPSACALFSLWAFFRGQKGDLVLKAALVLCFVLFLCALYGFAQYAGYDFIELEVRGKPVAFMGNVNFTSQFLIAAIPLVLAFTLTDPRRVVFLVPFLVSLLHLLLLKSRGGILGGVLGILLTAGGFCFLRFGKKGKTRGREGKNTAVVIILGILITGGTFFLLDQGETVKELASSFSVSPESNRYRLLAWQASLNLAMDRPILGVGPGRFRFLHPLYSSEELWKLKGQFSRIRHIRAHNDYLNIFCELGFVGLLLFIIIMAILAAGVIRYMKGENGIREKTICLGLAGCVAATLVQSIFDFNLYNPASGLLFWVMAGFLAARVFPRGRVGIIHRFMGVCLLVLSVFALSIVPFRAAGALAVERLIRRAEVSFQSHRLEEAETFASRALEIDPDNINALAILADSRRNRKGREKQALETYRKWARIEPFYVPIYNRMGETWYRLGSIKEAGHAFEKALSINPVSVPVLLNLGNLALGEGEYEKAVSFYERAASVGGDLVEKNEAQFGIALFQLGRPLEAIGHLEKGLVSLPEKAPLILELLGDSYAAVGDLEKAREKWGEAFLLTKTPRLQTKLGSDYRRR